MGKKITGKKGHERNRNKNDEPNTLEVVINGENGLLMSVGDSVELHNECTELNESGHKVSDKDVELRVTQSETMEYGDDVGEKKKKKKKTLEIRDGVELSASETEAVMKDDVDEDEKRRKNKQRNDVGGNDTGLSVSQVQTVVRDNKKKKENTKLQELSGNAAVFSVIQSEAVMDSDVHANKKKKGKKRQEVGDNDFESGISQKEAAIEGDVDTNNEKGKDRKQKKRKLEVNDDENKTQKPRNKNKRINSEDIVTEVKEASKQKHFGLEENTSLQKNDQANAGNNADLEARKKSKKIYKEAMNNDDADIVSSLNDFAADNCMEKVVRDMTYSEEQDMAEVMNGKETGPKKKKKKQRQGDQGVDDVTDGEAGREREQLDGIRLEKVEDQRKEKKRKRKEHSNDAQAKKLHNVNSRVEDIVDQESSEHLSRNEAVSRNMEGRSVSEEEDKKDKKKKDKSVKKRSNGDKKVSRTKKGIEPTDPSENSTLTKRSTKVSFSDHVHIFHYSDDSSNDKDPENAGLVRGKRFSLEEDEMIRKAVTNYIDAHEFGEDGLNMVLHCRSHPEVKNCWKEIGAGLPWRPYESIYYRAHILFERDENRKWTPEELEVVRKFHKKHGSDWKTLADALGKHRLHVKDTWRRIRLPNQKKGQWSQEEYQKLFDLVNLDLRARAFEEKKSKHGMLRDNISWEAICDKLETRSNSICCMKWYEQITSPMVAEGKWADTDDYHLVNALSGLDACCMDDVDWDNLLEHRFGTICQKRWNQMVKHLGPDRNKSFLEQVEILSTRYCPDVLEAREAYNSQLQC